jgi:Ca-activated chloride channel family protein
VAFVLDRSGSMSGWKMVAARRALARMVETLTDRDRFTVLAFDDRIETPPGLDGPNLVPATDRRRFQTAEYLGRVDARGGTEMAQPLAAAAEALTRDGADRGRDRVLVLVTDGQVGNEDQMLRTLGPRLKGVRVFTLGIDQAVNAAFLRRLADLGGGQSEVVESEERLEEVMDRVHRLIGTPVLTGVKLEPAGLQYVPDSLVPSRLPDLFAGSPLFVLGRYRGKAAHGISVQARGPDGAMWATEVVARREASPVAAVAWARGRLRELEDRYVVGAGDKTKLEKDITDLSLRFGVLCRFTAYVAVDRSEVVNAGGQAHGVVQPVEQPSGWAQPMAACAPPPMAFRRAMSAPPKSAAAEEELDLCMDFGPEEALDRAVAPPPRSIPYMAPEQMAPPGSRGRSYRREAPKAKSAAAKGPGLLQRLLDLFRGGPKKDKAGAPPAAIDREPYRRRLADVLRQMEQAPADAAARLAALRSLAPTLEEVFTQWTQAGERDDAVRRLGEVVVALQALLAEAKPADAAVGALWTKTEGVLRECLTLAGGTPGREGFWK